MKRAQAKVEKELKYALSESGYRALIERFDPSGKAGKKQVNTYFDTPRAALRRKGIGFRLRFIDEKSAEMTAKFPSAADNRAQHGFKAREEIEVTVPIATARKLAKRGILEAKLLPVKELKKRVAAGELNDFRALGNLTTFRTKTKHCGLMLEIDACEVFGKRFYELEVETTSPKRADKVVRDLLKEHGLKVRPLGRSKLARFWREYRKTRATR